MQDMQKTAFLILMCMEKHGDVAKIERANLYPFCISKLNNNFLDILMDNLPTILPPNKDVDHKMKVHLGSPPPIKALVG
jgi:hypothetical protein